MKIEDGWVYFDHTECERFSPKLKGDQYKVYSDTWYSYVSDFDSNTIRVRNFNPTDKAVRYRRPLSNCTPAQLGIDTVYEHYL